MHVYLFHTLRGSPSRGDCEDAEMIDLPFFETRCRSALETQQDALSGYFNRHITFIEKINKLYLHAK
jgi:hypothetical protein